MAEAPQYDEFGNPINGGFWGGGAAEITPNTAPIEFGGETFNPSAEGHGTYETASGSAPIANSGGSTPAPAPATSAPQLPEFGMGDMNMPPPPTFDQPSDESLVQPASNGLSADDQAVRSGAESVFGFDPGGSKYSGGSNRRANPLRDTDIGKRFMGASKAGTAYGNAFDKEGLLGGGKNAQLAGGDNAELGSQPSDLLLQMLQLLGQQG